MLESHMLFSHFTGLLVGLVVGGGISLIGLVPGIIFVMQKVKARRAQRLRVKYFKKNRGLLLQQLVDKDIAERMIFIP
jgi:Ca2+/Na+ antiporter